MAEFYQHHVGFITPDECEILIKQTRLFKEIFYNDVTLENHTAYKADTTPHRTSHAYAIRRLPTQADAGRLPAICLNTLSGDLADLVETSNEVLNILGLGYNNYLRALFNVQEYFNNSEPVPVHNDGELLDFSTVGGQLRIKRSIRPRQVAVLTLVNDTDHGGTRLHMPNGETALVRAQAGDLLVFRNDLCLHSVDALGGTVKRSDGILRMTIGWRSLNAKTYYSDADDTARMLKPLSTRDADDITEDWYRNEWPRLWDQINGVKAAF